MKQNDSVVLPILFANFKNMNQSKYLQKCTHKTGNCKIRLNYSFSLREFDVRNVVSIMTLLSRTVLDFYLSDRLLVHTICEWL